MRIPVDVETMSDYPNVVAVGRRDIAAVAEIPMAR
jgi:hypothetical protein